MHLTVKRDSAAQGACGHFGGGGRASAHIVSRRKHIDKNHYASRKAAAQVISAIR